MKTLLTVCLLMLSCVAQAMPPKAPAPLWTAKISSRRVSDSEYRPDARIAAAASEVAVIVSEPGTVTALDARTGKERWAFQSSPSTLKNRGSRWDVVGTSGDTQGQAVVTLVRVDPAPLQIGTQKSQPTGDTFFALHGVEAATGQRLWRKDYVGSPSPYLVCVMASSLCPCQATVQTEPIGRIGSIWTRKPANKWNWIRHKAAIGPEAAHSCGVL